MLRALLLSMLLLAPGLARAQDMLGLIRAGRWAEADSQAAEMADPVGRKLVTYYRLLNPGSGGAAREIGQFMAENPDWPSRALLERRREAALAADPDDVATLAECARDGLTPSGVDGLLRCAEAAARAGQPDQAASWARQAWLIGPTEAGWEARMMQRWGGVIGAPAQWARFDRLAWTDTQAATRQLARVDPADRTLGIARLALRRDDVSALAIVAALPDGAAATPALMLEQAKWLRRAGQDDAALALWLAAGTQAEKAADTAHQADFWAERNLLARRLLRQGDDAGAYALADRHAQTQSEQVADAEFLAGFIALGRLRDTAAATRHFRTLASLSRAAITQGRAHYWLARSGGGAAEYRLAADYPNTFYGQLAAVALDGGSAGLDRRIEAASATRVDPARGLDYAGRELARAALHLAAWGDPRRAVPFLLRLQEITQDAADKTLPGRLAAGLGLTDTAVVLARRAGTAGAVPLDTGWPVGADIPENAGVEPALALAVIRQESSFDAATGSPAGARGLMQLMPATAAATARRIGLAFSPSAIADPVTNIRLGTAYLGQLLDQYDHSTPVAVAAYNAGPRPVAEWLGANGDPRKAGVDPIDWIELIGFAETRNYVQRVIENQVIYRVKLAHAGPHPLAREER